MEPCWSRDQRELFYSWEAAYYAVQISTEGGEVRPSAPKQLFEGVFVEAIPVRAYDVGPDGRFLMIKRDPNRRSRTREAMAPTRIEVVANWYEELRAKVPVE